MEQIAAVLHQHFQCLVLVMLHSCEKWSIPALVAALYEVFEVAELAQHGGELLMSMRHTMVQGISSTLIFDSKRPSRFHIDP